MGVFSQINTVGEITYVVLISLLLVLVWIVVRRIIRSTEDVLQVKAKQREDFETIHTESPVDDLEKQSREVAQDSIKSRFSLVRLLINPLIAIAWGSLVLIPFLDRVPANVASFVVGTLTIVVGIAAKPFLENIFAGVVLSFAQPFRIGDTVNIDGHWGTIEKIERTFTVVRIWDWRRYVIPNSKLISKEFVNYSSEDSYQWAYVEFWVSYDADLDQVEALAAEATRNSKYFVDYEPPRFWVMEMGKEGIRCWAAGWTDSPSDAWALTHDLRTNLIKSFRQNDIRCHVYHHEFQPGQNPVGENAA